MQLHLFQMLIFVRSLKQSESNRNVRNGSDIVCISSQLCDLYLARTLKACNLKLLIGVKMHASKIEVRYVMHSSNMINKQGAK